MTERMAKVTKAICSLILSILVCLLLPVPAFADGVGAVTGSFSAGLEISNVSASAIREYGAAISWETNGNATSQVFYDTVAHDDITGYAYQTSEDLSLVSVHRLSLTGLSASTTYHYRVKSVAMVDSIEYIAISPDNTFRIAMGGGGGYEYPGDTVSLIGLTSTTTLRLNNAGVAQTSAQLTTLDGQVSLNIPTGTLLLNVQGQPLTSLSVSATTSVPPLLLSAVVLTYDFGPAGATFTPPITLTLKYDLTILPTGVSEGTLYIAYWDGSQWQVLTSTVDTEAKTVTAPISHFTQFALMGKLPIPIPTPTLPTPTPTLPIPTPTLPTPTPTLPTPTPTPPIPTPTLPTPTPTPLTPNWYLIGDVIAAVIVIGVVIWLLVARRRY